MKKHLLKIQKILLVFITIAISTTIIYTNPKESLTVNAAETGKFYNEKISKESKNRYKDKLKQNFKAPDVKQTQKNAFQELLFEGYQEDLAQREESLKVFVKGETEKRLYFLSPVHILYKDQWLEPEEIESMKSKRYSTQSMTMNTKTVQLEYDNKPILTLDKEEISDVSLTTQGFVGKTHINKDAAIPFSVTDGISVELDEAKQTVLLKEKTNDTVVGEVLLRISNDDTINTAYSPTLELETVDENNYAVSFSPQSIANKGASFDVDLEGAVKKKYDSSKVYLYGVRSGSSFKSNSYNPGGYIGAVNSAVIGNGNYNDGYIFCAGECKTESQNNYGIISFYNGQKMSDVIGKNRTVSDARLVMTYRTNRQANDGKGAKYQAYMLDPSRNFNVNNVNNITYDNFQKYLNQSSSVIPFGKAETASGYSGTVNFDITGIMQSWENSGTHHGIMIKGESKADGSFLEAAHFFLNHTHNDISGRPYIEVTTVKNEPVSNDYKLEDATLNLHPFTANSRSNNVIQFAALGFDGVTKPGSIVDVYVKEKNQDVFANSGAALNGYRQFPQFTKELGYDLPKDVQTYYRLTSNYQLADLLYSNDLKVNTLYQVKYQSHYNGKSSNLKNSDEFLLYRVTAYDRLPRLLNFYGITDKTQFMQDNNMSDELLVEGNVLFVRNPKKNKDKIYQPPALSENDKRMIDNNLLGRNQHCVYGYEPINFNTGNFLYSNPDTGSIDYDKEILFERSYNSLGGGKVGIFGRNWTLSLYKELYFLGNGNIEFSDGTGRILTFEKEGDAYVAFYDNDYTLEKIPLRKEKITVDSGYYDQDEKPRTKEIEITHYGYVIKNSATNESMSFDELGNITSYKQTQYDLPLKYEYNNYELSKIITPAGREFKIKLNEWGLISSITDPAGNAVHYQYDNNLNLIKFNDQMGYEIAYHYDSSSYLKSYTGREHDDLVIQNTYDIHGRVIKQKDALGQISEFNYYEDHTEIVNFKGNITKVYKDNYGYTTRVEEEGLNPTEHTYDANGNLTSTKSSNGEVHSYTYDKDNNLIREVNALNQEKTYQYDKQNNVIGIVDFNGEKTTFTYDSENRLTGSYYPNGKSELKEYNQFNQVTYEKDMYGFEKRYTYNKGSLEKISYSDQTSKSFTYNQLGNLKSETDENGNTVEYIYDARSELIKENHPHHSLEYVYDGDGHKVSEVDGNGNRINYVYDAWSRVIEIKDITSSTKYTYDENGNLTKVTDSLGNSEQYEYDIHNRLIKSTDALNRIITYEYDAHDNLIKTVNPLNQAKTFEYDEQNRLIKETFLDRFTNYEYDKNGNLSKTTDSFQNTVTFKYDENNLLTEMTDEKGTITKYTYDGDRIVEKEYQGLVWTYTYNNRGQEVESLDPLQRITTNVYANNGLVLKNNLNGLMTTTFEYDRENRISKIKDAQGYENSYEYDGNGNIIKELDENGHVTEHFYDHQNRKIKTIIPEGYHYEFEYDAVSNLIKESGYDLINDTVITTSYQYDAKGNLILEIDPLNRKTSYAYNELDQVISINENGRETTFIYNDYSEKIRENNTFTQTDYQYNDKGLLSKISDQLGYEYHYEYNDKQELIKTTNELNQVETFEYNERGHLVKTTDARGNHEYFETNVLSEIIKSVDSLGNVTYYEYNDLGQLIESNQDNIYLNNEIDNRGNVVSQKETGKKKIEYEYDGNNNTIKTTQGNKNFQSIYDKENRVIQEIDSLGNITKYKYDILNQIVAIEYPDSSTEQFKYDAGGRLVMSVDQLGFATYYEYDTYDNLVKETNALGISTTYEYDKHDNLIKETQAGKKSTEYTYDERQRISSIKSPNGNKIVNSYTDFDAIKTITYPNGLVKEHTYNETFDLIQENYQGKEAENTYTYDQYGRIIKETNNLNNSTYYTYDKYGNVIKTMTNDLKKETIFDEHQRVIKTIDEKGYEFNFTYNEYGQKEKEYDNLGFYKEFSYDTEGNIIVETTSLGTTQYEYDAMGRLIKLTAPTKESIIYEYDLKGQLIKETDPLNNSETYTYDALGRTVEVVDARNHRKVYEYNELDQIVRFQEDSGRIMDYTYDLENNLLETKYKDNSYEKRTYDSMNQIIKIETTDKTKDSFKYDKFGNVLEETISGTTYQYTYNDLNQVIAKKAGNDRYEYEYNAIGELSKAQKNGVMTQIKYNKNYEVIEVIDENKNIISYEYDIKGRQNKIIYPDGKVVNYTYNEHDFLVKVEDGKSVTEYTHDAVGNILTTELEDIKTESNYDALGNLILQTSTKNNTLINTLSYKRNELGDVIEEINQTDTSKIIKTYLYDEANQVIEEKVNNNGQETKTSYTYDSWGNKDKVIEETNNNSIETRYLYNKKNQLVETRTQEDHIKLTYDTQGNVIKKSYSNGLVENYEYDGTNQLLKTNDNYGKIVEYTYDALQERTSRKETLPYNYFVVKPENKKRNIRKDVDAIFDSATQSIKETVDDQYFCTISFIDDTTKVTKETFVNDITQEHTEVLETYRDNKLYESHTYGIERLKTDAKNNTTTQYLSNGKLDVIATVTSNHIQWFDYNLSGSLNTSFTPQFGYSGEAHDGALQYLRARYYDTELGVFISEDTYRGTPTNQLSQNRYLYTENNPINSLDPSGHFLNKLVSGTKKLVSNVGKGLKKVGTAIAKTTKKVGTAIAKTTKKVGTAIAKTAKKVGTTIATTAKKTVTKVATVAKKAATHLSGQDVVYSKNLQSNKTASVGYNTEFINEIENDKVGHKQGKDRKKLFKEIAKYEVDLKNGKITQHDYEAKKQELIKKYCDTYNLDSVSFQQSESYRTRLKESIERREKINKGKSVVSKGAKVLAVVAGTAVVAGAVFLTAGTLAIPLAAGSTFAAGFSSFSLGVATMAGKVAVLAGSVQAFLGGGQVVAGAIDKDTDYMYEGGMNLFSGGMSAMTGKQIKGAAIGLTKTLDTVKGTGNPLSSDELKNIGTKGDNSGIRHVNGSAQDARAMFDKQVLSDTVKEVQPGVFVGQGADGFTYTFRASSVSGPPTIDVNGIPGLRKIKFIP